LAKILIEAINIFGNLKVATEPSPERRAVHFLPLNVVSVFLVTLRMIDRIYPTFETSNEAVDVFKAPVD
jgi:hypothetical protein